MATKEELKELAKDLYKRLGGVRTKDGRIVRGLLACWEAAELNAAQHSVQRIGGKPCPECGKLGGSHLWSCSIGNSANR